MFCKLCRFQGFGDRRASGCFRFGRPYIIGWIFLLEKVGSRLNRNAIIHFLREPATDVVKWKLKIGD